MRDRLREELALVERQYGALDIAEDLSSFVITGMPLPKGWSTEETPVLVLIPAGYPTTPPDNFYVRNDLTLAGGGEPGNAPKDQAQRNATWRMFSWHVDETWQPSAAPARGDNLLTFLAGCEQRLSELS